MVRCEILQQILNRVITKATTPVHHYIGKSGTIQDYGNSTVWWSLSLVIVIPTTVSNYFGGAAEYLVSDQNLDPDAKILSSCHCHLLFLQSLFAQVYLAPDILKDPIQKVLLASTKFTMNSKHYEFKSYLELLFQVFL